MNTTRQLVAEAIGTFFLCFAGIGAIVSVSAPIESGVGLVGIALAHGLALSVAVSIFAGTSGSHFNPAVTIGMLSTGRIEAPRAVMYMIAQLVGAIVAAAACNYIFPADAVKDDNLGIPLPADWVPTPVLFTTEFILTFLLVIAIFGTAVDNKAISMKLGGFAIGLTVTFDILAGGTVTGASMNPARSFGPALIHGDFSHHIWYWIAPIAGAVAAALLFQHVLLDPEEPA